jgi:protocatechuate 3,4-dioxygenase beta subunit
MPASRKLPSTPKLSISRRGILVVTGTAAASHIVGCSTDSEGTPSGTGGGNGSNVGGTGGSVSTGSGGSSGSGGNGAGSGGAGGNPGSGGSAAVDAGASGGSGGSPDAGSFPADARLEAGNQPGMVDGATAACKVTSPDQLGPYHLDGHLERAVITAGGEGMRLVVKGRVLNSNCQPLAKAELDIWAANGKGVYSETPTGWCRGKVHTDNEGGYMFETVYPGPYLGRPRHLHLIIAQPGYTKVTTQMYFKGENPDIPSNAVEKNMVNGAWESEFLIVLKGGGMAARTPRIHTPDKLPRRFWGEWFRPSKQA